VHSQLQLVTGSTLWPQNGRTPCKFLGSISTAT
jgi:hypothetical protein